MKLADVTSGKDNNFNLIRIMAALAVLISHSFALVSGSPEDEPLRGLLGMSPGNIAVDIFFITSGFLVTASLLNRRNMTEFVVARILRVAPALVVMILLTVFVLGPFFTTLPLGTYFYAAETHRYIIKCLTLFAGVAFDLPGVFESNPIPRTVNGSLWSLTYEVRMYAILAILWIVGGVLKLAPGRFLNISANLLALVGGCFVMWAHFFAPDQVNFVNFARLIFMFFVGASFYCYREHVVLSRSVFVGMTFLILMACLDKDLFFVVYFFSLAYLTFFIAYVPGGYIRIYNRVGDYSYGLYIYACPVQQSIMALRPETSVSELIFMSGAISFVCAAISWHLIEKHALALKGWGGRRKKIG